MRFLVILLLIFCGSATSFSQKGSSDQILLKSIKMNEGFIMPATEEPILVIRGNLITAAKGHELVYSEKHDMVWGQPVGAAFGSDQILEAKKDKDKKGKGKKEKKDKKDGKVLV